MLQARASADAIVLRRLDRWINGLIDHWLALFNGMMALYVALPLLAPALMAVGLSAPARLIYWGYSYTCHQLPSHSWFLWGYQMAYCQRDTALYGAMLLGGIAYARRRYWTRGLPFWAYVLLSLPIAIDGGTALFGLRDSTPLLRTLTGTLFGVATTWYVYPLLDRALAGLNVPPDATPSVAEATHEPSPRPD